MNTNIIMLTLLTVLSFNIYSMDRNQELSKAVLDNNIAKVKELISKYWKGNSLIGNIYINSFIHYAITTNNKELLELIVAYGVNINAVNEYGNTPLHYACEIGNKEMAQVLINNKANVNAKNSYKIAALSVSLSRGYTDLAKLLMSNGADVNIQDNWGETALDIAAIKGYTELVELLLETGADKTKTRFNSIATTRLAVNNPVIIETLDSYVPIAKR